MQVNTVTYIILGVIATIAIVVVTILDEIKADACREAGGHWLHHDHYCVEPFSKGQP